MEEMSFLSNHDIIGVTITNTEDVSRNAIPSTTQLEILNMFLQVLLVLTVLLQEHHNRFTNQTSESLIVHLMNSCCRLTIPYDFKHTYLVLRCNHIIRLHTIIILSRRKIIKRTETIFSKKNDQIMYTVNRDCYPTKSYP